MLLATKKPKLAVLPYRYHKKCKVVLDLRAFANRRNFSRRAQRPMRRAYGKSRFGNAIAGKRIKLSNELRHLKSVSRLSERTGFAPASFPTLQPQDRTNHWWHDRRHDRVFLGRQLLEASRTQYHKNLGGELQRRSGLVYEYCHRSADLPACGILYGYLPYETVALRDGFPRWRRGGQVTS